MRVDHPLTAPSCPSCEVPMIRRTNSRTGGVFWGCRRFPICRGSRDIGSESREFNVEDASQSPAQFDVPGNDSALGAVERQYRYAAADRGLYSSPSPRSALMDVLGRCLNFVQGAAYTLIAFIGLSVLGLLAAMIVLGNPLILLAALAVRRNNDHRRGRRRYRRY